MARFMAHCTVAHHCTCATCVHINLILGAFGFSGLHCSCARINIERAGSLVRLPHDKTPAHASILCYICLYIQTVYNSMPILTSACMAEDVGTGSRNQVLGFQFPPTGEPNEFLIIGALEAQGMTLTERSTSSCPSSITPPPTMSRFE